MIAVRGVLVFGLMEAPEKVKGIGPSCIKRHLMSVTQRNPTTSRACGVAVTWSKN